MVAVPLSVEWSLLGFLRQRPMHGYEIARRLANPEGIGLVWRLKQSHVYALLAKLETQQYIAYTTQAEGARPPRKVYYVTEQGTEAFLAWLRRPVTHAREMRLEFLAKLYFASLEEPSVVTQLLEAQRAAIRQWLAEQHALAAPLRETRPYEWLVHQFRIGQMEAMLAWLDSCTGVLLARHEKQA